MLALHLLALAFVQSSATYAVPLEELELASGGILPSYGYEPPWRTWDADGTRIPWVAIEGEGDVIFRASAAVLDFSAGDDGDDGESSGLGSLVIHTREARDVVGRLFLPKASGEGFLRLDFRVPAARATASESDFRLAELERYRELLRQRLPGGAWFRHRHDEVRSALGPDIAPPADLEAWQQPRAEFRDPADALGLFSGGRALYENLQLERGLPASPEAEATVALDTLQGITVRALDWGPRLAPGETKVDAL
ncbi:MAG: hypothetical protein HOP15_18625, partial [Planctomycetes bacterium]|nr:hypothetical protein [Planctomycetota bacterium]